MRSAASASPTYMSLCVRTFIVFLFPIAMSFLVVVIPLNVGDGMTGGDFDPLQHSSGIDGLKRQTGMALFLCVWSFVYFKSLATFSRAYVWEE